jgi:LacI family transcriptional regulator
MTKRVLLSDVAEAAEVSKTTVSLVLNDIPSIRIPEATRARVLRAAQELGYQQKFTIKRAELDRPPVIGALINEISQAYPINLLDGLQAAAEDKEVQIVIQITDGRPEREREALATLQQLGAAGVIYAMTFNAEVTPVVELERFRHVLLNCRRIDGAGTSVVLADEAIGRAAARHLLDRGYRRIAILTGDPWQIGARERRAGCEAELAEAGLAPTHVEAGMWDHRITAEITERIVSGPDRPDAIFCQNDLMARGALAALNGMDVRVPQDVAVLGCDNREFSRYLSPALTTFSVPHAEMAERALEILCAEGPLSGESIAMRGNVIQGGTT